ncbi:MAG: type II toxin-antitoxin system antitoxin SocA domain-containing protein [Patescibacteria group bacterium]
MTENIQNKITRYLVYKYTFDGDLVTNLKIQKVLYFIYAWFLLNKNKRCFTEKFQAWPIGPVLPSIYQTLKKYGSSPISPDFSKITKGEDVEKLKKELGNSLLETIDEVYKVYGIKSAFELVGLTHNELSWSRARKGLDATAKTDKELSDDDIYEQHKKRKK